MSDPVMTVDELQSYLEEIFPQQKDYLHVMDIGPMRARMRYKVEYQHLRPGDTVSGPTMFTIADCAFFAAALAMKGRQAMMVTSTLTINFLRRPPAADLEAEARIMKLGRTLITGEVTVFSQAVDDPVAHVTTSYAVPR